MGEQAKSARAQIRVQSVTRRTVVDEPATGFNDGMIPPFTVDGIPILPGETPREYHKRALEWIRVEAATRPANCRYISRKQLLARLIAIPAAIVAVAHLSHAL